MTIRLVLISVMALVALHPRAICAQTLRTDSTDMPAITGEAHPSAPVLRTDLPGMPADSTQAPPKKSWLAKVVGFFDFNNPDPRYISPNLYNFTFMLNTSSSYEYYKIASTGTHEQSISFAPSPSRKLGAYFGWRWIFLGWSVDVDDIFGSKQGKSKKTEYNLSLYSAKVGVDFYYLKSGNRFKVKGLSGFEDIGSQDIGKEFRFDGLKVNMMGINAYYIFNNRRFSYPAAFSQSTNQRKSAGSFLTGFSYSTHKLMFDYRQLPPELISQLEPSLRFQKIRYHDYSLNFGYAYNWVFAKNCLACLSVTPAIAYKKAGITSKEEGYDAETYHSVNFDVITRAAIVYNNAKYYVGASLLAHTYDYHKKRFWINNTYGILQIYVGFNFNKKKEFRNRQ